MHDPVGVFSRTRELYLSYLDTAFRIEDPGLAEERQQLLREAGRMCTDPFLEPQPEWAQDGRRFEDLLKEQGPEAALGEMSPKARHLFLQLIGCDSLAVGTMVNYSSPIATNCKCCREV